MRVLPGAGLELARGVWIAGGFPKKEGRVPDVPFRQGQNSAHPNQSDSNPMADNEEKRDNKRRRVTETDVSMQGFVNLWLDASFEMIVGL